MSSLRSERLEGRAYSRTISGWQGGIQPVVHSLPGLLCKGKRARMKSYLTALAISLSAPLTAIAANPLTPYEQRVCRSARQCADIVKRHNIDEFDYSVLAAEFNRFGPRSVSALTNIASQETRAQLSTLLSELNDQMAVNIVLRLAQSNDADDRGLAAFLLERLNFAEGTGLDLAANTYPVVARLAVEHPSENLVTLLSQYPYETAKPALEALLGSRETRVITAAYQRLYEASRNDANQALNRQMLKTSDLPVAIAIGQMMAGRDRTRQSHYYAAWLDQIANNEAYPDAMQIGARAGSLMVWRRDAPFTSNANLTDHILRLPDETLEMTIKYWTFTRTGGDILPAWLTMMETKPAFRRDILVALRVGKASDAVIGPFVDVGLSDPKRARTVMDALRLIPNGGAEAWTEQLRTLADTHPFDTVRHLARTKYDSSISSDNADRIGGTDPAVKAARTRDLYCSHGDWIDPSTVTAQFILKPSDLADLPYGYGASARGFTTAYPARDRWIAGFDRGEFGGSLLGFDYAAGAAELLLNDNTQLITPVTPVPLGQHPEALWVFSGLAHMTINESQVMTLAPDDDSHPTFVWELPNPLRRAYRLEDGSLLLQFHDETTAFRSDVRENIRYRSWADSHPPLRLTSQGALMPACPLKMTP